MSNKKHVLKCLPESNCSAEFVLKCWMHVRQSQDLPQHSCLQSLCYEKHCVPKGEKVFPGEQPRRKGAIRSKISLTSPATPLTSPNSRSRQRRTTKKEKKYIRFPAEKWDVPVPSSPLVYPSNAARSRLLPAWKLIDHKMWSHGVPVSSYLLASSTSKPLHSLAVRRRVFKLTTAGWPFCFHRQNGLQPPMIQEAMDTFVCWP